MPKKMSVARISPNVGASVIATTNQSVGDGGGKLVLPAPADGTTLYVSGFIITGNAQKTALPVASLTGLIGGGGTLNFLLSLQAGNAITPLVVNFQTPISAAQANTAINLIVPDFGPGGIAYASMWGISA
jgi:hypothetical protein